MVIVRCHNKVDVVLGTLDVDALGFDLNGLFSDESFENARMLFIPSVKSLVSEQYHNVPQMSVEIADQMAGVAHLEEVAAEQRAEGFGEEGLAYTFAAPQHHSHLPWAIGLLHATGHPAQEVRVNQ